MAVWWGMAGRAYSHLDTSIYFQWQVSACRWIRLCAELLLGEARMTVLMEASHIAVRMLVFISNDDDRFQLVGGELVPFYFRQSNFVGNWCSQREPNNLIGGRLTLTVTEIIIWQISKFKYKFKFFAPHPVQSNRKLQSWNFVEQTKITAQFTLEKEKPLAATTWKCQRSDI